GATPCDLPLLTSVHRGRERTEGAPAVRHGMLLLRSHLRKRAAVALQRYEHRVVTESALSTRHGGDETLDVAPRDDLSRIGPARDGDGGEPGGSKRRIDALELAQQLGDVVGVRRMFTRVAC